MNNRDSRPERGNAQFTASLLKALGLHLLVLMLLFVSFSSAPEFEPAKPIVRATLVQLNSKSPATTQTDQKIAGEAERTAAQRHEAEELQRDQQKQQQEQEAAQRAAAEQKKAATAQAASAQAEKDQAAKEQSKAAEERKKAEQVEQQKAAEVKRKADAAKKLVDEQAAKKAAAEAAKRKETEDAKRKATDDAKRKADAAKKAEADRVAKLKRDQEEAKAKALSELLASETQYQRAQADQMGDEVAASYDDVIRRYVSEQWRRPPTARNGMLVEVRISMLPSGDITDAVITRSSGDAGFDQSALQAVRNVGRIPEMQQLSRESLSTFDRLYRQRTLRFKPEDLAF